MKSSILRRILIAIAVLLIAYPATAAAQKVVRIGTVVDGTWARDQDLIDTMIKEITGMAGREFNVRFPEEKQLSGDWQPERIRKALDRLLGDPQVDIVLSLGSVASHIASTRTSLPKPVVAPFIVDADIQKLPNKNGTSGVKHLSYINIFRNTESDIAIFREILPFKRLGILVDDSMLAGIPELKTLVGPVARRAKIRIDLVRVSDSADEALARIPPGTEAVVFGSLMRFSDDEFKTLADGFIDRRLPSFSNWGRNDVEDGILASVVPDNSWQHLARSVAINVYEIMRGEPAATLPTSYNEGEKLTINMATARAIGVYPNWRILTEAELIQDTAAGTIRALTLEQAVNEALLANLDLLAANRNVTAGIEQVKEARSPLLPQVDIGLLGRAIDPDRAQYSRGTFPEKLVRGTASASQLIYSEKTWATYDIEKYLQNARIEERDTVELDIIQIAATAYLNVLRVKSIERIQKENLKLSRANLERARVRQNIGAAGPEEVYRWEAQIAQNRQLVLQAESNSIDAMNALNRVLNRPLNEVFTAVDADYNNPAKTIGSDRVYAYLDNPESLRLFRNYLLQVGVPAAPELKRIDETIAAQERSLTAAKRDFWVPDISIQGNVNEDFERSGSGSDYSPIPGTQTPDSSFWTASINASLPLFTSGRRTATVRRNREEIARLRYTRSATALVVQERIYNASNLVRASFPSLRLTRDAQEASDKNLELITSSYIRGTKSIIDLLDAQNQALTASQRTVNAVYDFLIDLTAVQRAISQYVFLFPDADQDAWFDDLDAFIKKTTTVSPLKKTE